MRRFTEAQKWNERRTEGKLPASNGGEEAQGSRQPFSLNKCRVLATPYKQRCSGQATHTCGRWCQTLPSLWKSDKIYLTQCQGSTAFLPSYPTARNRVCTNNRSSAFRVLEKKEAKISILKDTDIQFCK